MRPSQHLKVTLPPPLLPSPFGHSVSKNRCASHRLLWLSMLRIPGVIHPPPNPHVSASPAANRLNYEFPSFPPFLSV
ncbi:uncharacterized protein BDZ83DRAFT_52799 [Colletotrichum acutatum]|uniref:Uncharacterized protein n=1 Tax=Glomerella acutata TaxID=27357 RepID=A0AAD8XL63_GLOAC|nr:uncharacterized protein BDZ83DRAFT_52799 [Colletotrichum acutatum]KAK1729387.1 hypothetical protein BDZ83DRAFT_52799 [Colletotrichum acutatum]